MKPTKQIIIAIVCAICAITLVAYVCQDTDIYCNYQDVKCVSIVRNERGNVTGYTATIKVEHQRKQTIDIDWTSYQKLTAGIYHNNEALIFSERRNTYRMRQNLSSVSTTQLNK